MRGGGYDGYVRTDGESEHDRGRELRPAAAAQVCRDGAAPERAVPAREPITGAGINCAISGTSQSGDCSEDLTQGAQLTLTAAAAGGGSFLGWSGACASAGVTLSCTITVNQAMTVAASFAPPPTPPPPPPPNYTVTIRAGASSGGTGTVSGTGISCAIATSSQSGDCSDTFPSGTQLTLTAAATSGSSFAGWGGACAAAGTTATCTLTVSQNTTVDASFAPPPPPRYVVTVAAGSSSTGTGTITGPGISCTISAASQSGDCSEQVVQGTQLPLTSTATGGSTFAGWGGACAAAGTTATCTLTVSQNTTVNASFTPPPPPRYVVTVAAGSSSTGTGTITGPGISCTISAASQSGDCSEQVVQGTQLPLTSTATGGSTFAGWAGACSGTAATCTITVSQATTVGASFTAPPPPPPPPNLAGFWSGSDAGTNIHYHITLAQSGATLSLPSCVAGDCRLISLSSTGAGWLGASYLDIASLTGTVSSGSVTFTMNLGDRTVTFEGALTSPTQMVGQVSGPTMPAQSLTLVKQ